MYKYVRTPHIQGSRFQHGDHDLEAVPFSELRGKHLVIEEKMDGANSGISFENGAMKTQSRGHYLTGGPREKHFTMLKSWASCREHQLRECLGDRYVMYGEWMFAKHTVYYDLLPHYFMEFDVLDKRTGAFLSTPARRKLYRDHGLDEVIHSVLVLSQGVFASVEEMASLIGLSRFKSHRWNESLDEAARDAGYKDARLVHEHTDMSQQMEGLYVKWEDDGVVKGRYKFVRETFTNAILEQETHWLDRPIVRNALRSEGYRNMFG
jgi:hypothetical protein